MPQAVITHLPLVFSDMPTVLTVPAAPPELDRSKLVYIAKLKTPIFPGATIFDEVTLFAKERPDATGADFYVNNVIGNLKKIQPIPPDINATGFFWVQQTIEFVLDYAYFVSGTIEGDWQTLTPSQYTIKGGLSFVDWVTWGNKFFTDHLSQSRQFLTWQPNNKIIDEAQREFLYFLVNFVPLPTKLQLWANVTYEDGSTELLKAAEVGPVGQYRVYGVSVGYLALGLHLKTKRCRQYEVYLTNQSGELLTETRTYYIDDIYYESPYYFLFRNSLGGYDSMRFTGEIEESLRSERQTASRFLTNQVGRDFRENYEISVGSEREINVSTGFLADGEWLEYLQELERSTDAYRVTKTGLLPLLNIGNQLMYFKKTEKLQAASFKFKYAPTEAYFSKITDATNVVAPPSDDGGGDDTPVQTEFDLTALIDITNRTPADNEQITVTVAARNNELVSINTVVMLSILPTGVSFVSSTDARITHDGQHVTATIPSIAPGSIVLVTFLVEIDGTAGSTRVIPVEITAIGNGTPIGTLTDDVGLIISDGSEPPVVAGWTDTPRHTFTPTTTRGVYNPGNIPKFTLPATKKNVWMGAGRNYFTATSDDVFDYGFSHIVENCMVDGVEYYNNIGAIPPGYVSPIPPEKRVLVMAGGYYTQDAFGLWWAQDYSQYASAYFENVSGKPNHPDNSAFDNLWHNLGGAINEISGFGAKYNESAFPYAMVLDDVENDGNGTELFWQEHVNLKLHQVRKTKAVIGSALLICHDTRAFNCFSDPKQSHYTTDPNRPMWDAQAKLTSSSTSRGMPAGNHNRIVRDQIDYNHAGNYFYDWELLPAGTYNTSATAQSNGYPSSLTLNHETGVNWLCNLLANQEINDARSPKKRLAWLWLFCNDGLLYLKKRYPYLDNSGFVEIDNNYPDIPVAPEMAEGIAVWLFFTGAEGAILWDNVANLGGTAHSPVTVGNTYNSSYTGQAIDRLYACYEHYLHGLWRLFNHHADMFDGTETYLNQNTDLSFDNGSTWHKYNAVQLKEQGLPFARAIVKGNQILVCAQKPYADDAYAAEFLIRYKLNGYNFQATISLTGKGLWLKRATMPLA